jgi:hypothetical protein
MQDLHYPLSNFTRLLRDVLLGLTVLVGSFSGTLYCLASRLDGLHQKTKCAPRDVYLSSFLAWAIVPTAAVAPLDRTAFTELVCIFEAVHVAFRSLVLKTKLPLSFPNCGI